MSFTDGSWLCVVSVNICLGPLVIGRRGRTRRNLNGETVGS